MARQPADAGGMPEKMPEKATKTVPVSSNTGNPRVTVAFPFSKIEIRDGEPALVDLAELVGRLAGLCAALTHDVAPGRAGDAEELAEEAGRLAASLGRVR
jgi:hypothetical protein